jgi:hypothetical protein
MISVDTLEDNKAFALKEHADFPMLSNPDKKVAFAYQAIAPDAPPERQFAQHRVRCFTDQFYQPHRHLPGNHRSGHWQFDPA